MISSILCTDNSFHMFGLHYWLHYYYYSIPYMLNAHNFAFGRQVFHEPNRISPINTISNSNGLQFITHRIGLPVFYGFDNRFYNQLNLWPLTKFMTRTRTNDVFLAWPEYMRSNDRYCLNYTVDTCARKCGLRSNLMNFVVIHM